MTLAACGGGGGYGGGGGGGAATVKITPQNSRSAASTAFNGSQGAMNVGSASNAAYTAREEGAAPSRFDLHGFFTRQLTDFATGGVAMVIESETFPGEGPNGGSFTASFNDADNNGELSTGDSISVVYTNFVTDGVTLNGTETIDQLVLVDNGQTFTFEARITSNLTVSEGGQTETVSGSIRVSVSFTSSQLVTSLSVLTNLVEGDTTLNAGALFQTTIDIQSSNFTETVRGSVTDTSFGGTVAFDTTTPFSGSFEDDYPSAGVLTVTGTGGSQLRLTALSNVNVRVEVDENGDGTFEFSETITWVELEAAFEDA